MAYKVQVDMSGLKKQIDRTSEEGLKVKPCSPAFVPASVCIRRLVVFSSWRGFLGHLNDEILSHEIEQFHVQYEMDCTAGHIFLVPQTFSGSR